MNEFINCWKKYATFSGRARRKEYWLFVLFNAIAYFAAGFLDGLLGLPFVLALVYALAAILPSFAVCVRRLHDTNRSGWWILICLVPFIGGIWLLVLMLLDSTPGANQYGENPKGV